MSESVCWTARWVTTYYYIHINSNNFNCGFDVASRDKIDWLNEYQPNRGAISGYLKIFFRYCLHIWRDIKRQFLCIKAAA